MAVALAALRLYEYDLPRATFWKFHTANFFPKISDRTPSHPTFEWDIEMIVRYLLFRSDQPSLATRRSNSDMIRTCPATNEASAGLCSDTYAYASAKTILPMQESLERAIDGGKNPHHSKGLEQLTQCSRSSFLWHNNPFQVPWPLPRSSTHLGGNDAGPSTEKGPLSRCFSPVSPFWRRSTLS